jgi:hypothetical protein
VALEQALAHTPILRKEKEKPLHHTHIRHLHLRDERNSEKAPEMGLFSTSRFDECRTHSVRRSAYDGGHGEMGPIFQAY